MNTFAFWSLPEEQQADLRDDSGVCIRRLQACKQLATRMARDAGIYTPLSEQDEALLQGFHDVQQAHQGYIYEGVLDELCSAAGLLPSDAGLLAGRVQSLYQEREPVRYQAEAIALFEQWIRKKENGRE